MKKHIFSIIFLIISTLAIAQTKDTRYYEMRIYYCHPHRLDALIQRFTNHTTKIFEKHGMTNIGYWTPNDTTGRLIYFLSFPNKEARDASWKAFGADPEWQEVAKKSEETGKIVAKVESVFMNVADISPEIKESIVNPNRSFELRIYTPNPNKFEDLMARFRNHTREIFKKHNMTNIAYFTTIEKEGIQPKLYYLLAYPTEAEGKKSWVDFRKDPEWIKVRDESEKNGKLVEKTESIFMTPTTFSKIK